LGFRYLAAPGAASARYQALGGTEGISLPSPIIGWPIRRYVSVFPVQKLECPEKGLLTVLRIAFIAPVQGSLDLALNVGQLEHKGKTMPPARSKIANYENIPGEGSTHYSSRFSLSW
jgi:hypothetical protein